MGGGVAAWVEAAKVARVEAGGSDMGWRHRLRQRELPSRQGGGNMGGEWLDAGRSDAEWTWVGAARVEAAFDKAKLL